MRLFLIPATCYLILATLMGCSQPAETKADLVITHAQVATVDSTFSMAEAIAVKGDHIIAVGDAGSMQSLIGDSTRVMDVKGAFVMPGFIEGHGHFSGLGNSLIELNFLKVKSWDAIVAMVDSAVQKSKPGDWIIGRGWHQEKWTEPLEKSVLGYPYHDQLSQVSPDNPVLLDHASGHSLFANKKAMDLAGISDETPNPYGGEIVRDASGKAIGVFEERAQSLFQEPYQKYLDGISDEEKAAKWLKSVRLAEEDCLRKGITSFEDAGTTVAELQDFINLADHQDLNLRLWMMINDSYDHISDVAGQYPKLNIGGQHYLTVRAVKAYIDGALGSFGAWLLAPYADKPGFVGQNTTKIEDLERMANLCIDNNLQYCIHAIGDRANREVIDMYQRTFEAHPDQHDLRWRIEHAQHIDTADIPRFHQLGIIAAMQGIHCTSDAPFVEKRLGAFRAKYESYPWRSLWDAGAIIANGTDAPVEDVDPIQSYYATVTRRRADNGFTFYPEQCLTRKEALISYTRNNAYAAFEENEKGSLTPGRFADITILDTNLLTCADEAILNTKVLYTIVGGKIKYQKE
ncbi:MAG: amidohydrolase [Saprospiraceae bacterium]|nr:amidohydrolase [Saprospiraceae bacterium]MCB9321266.1 amidohydrolase [Lewinellaceae bacterium]